MAVFINVIVTAKGCFKIVCRGKDNAFSQLNARNKHKKVQKNALRDEFHFFAMNDDPLLIG